MGRGEGCKIGKYGFRETYQNGGLMNHCSSRKQKSAGVQALSSRTKMASPEEK